MGLVRSVAKLTKHTVLGVTGLFISKVRHKESHALLHELREIDRRVEQKLLDLHGAKKEFIHAVHKLKNALSRLKKRGETFEAQHLYHVYERYAQAFKDEKLLRKLRELHP